MLAVAGLPGVPGAACPIAVAKALPGKATGVADTGAAPARAAADGVPGRVAAAGPTRLVAVDGRAATAAAAGAADSAGDAMLRAGCSRPANRGELALGAECCRSRLPRSRQLWAPCRDGRCESWRDEAVPNLCSGSSRSAMLGAVPAAIEGRPVCIWIQGCCSS